MHTFNRHAPRLLRRHSQGFDPGADCAAAALARRVVHHPLRPLRALRAVATCLLGLEQWSFVVLERARQRRALARLDERMLSDIGISRADALHEASKPCWRG